VVGLVFFWQSLSPTLMPRSWVTQAAISAICTAVGYVVGVFLGYLGHLVLRRLGWVPSPTVTRRAWEVVGLAAIVVVALGLVMWPYWQNDQRELITLGDISPALGIPMLLLTIVLFVVLGLLGRTVWKGIRALDRFNRRHLPRAIASPVTVVLVLVLAVLLVRDVAFDAFTSWANSAFSASDKGTPEGIEPPTSPTVSGSPASLAPWDTLGYEGRRFVATATTADQLRAFHGADATTDEPVRVYVGLRSADSLEERAALAVRELDRTGAWDRDVLAVVTVTGTGWVDPDAARSLEQLHAGNTAMVAMQYSYLPSWISFLTDRDKAADAGAALFTAVHERWLELPEDERPQLVAFGLSLGSYGAEAAFASRDAASSVANLVARTDGALLVGPTNSNPIWSQITADREPGSPYWRPVYDGGTTVRFNNRPSDATLDDPAWRAPRVLYVQHPSDPVAFWSMDTLWSPPGWMDRPRGYDVPSQGYWFPFVTWTQSVFDLMAGFSAPPGFGHDYAPNYVAAWAQVAPVDGWTDDDTARLEAFLFAP